MTYPPPNNDPYGNQPPQQPYGNQPPQPGAPQPQYGAPQPGYGAPPPYGTPGYGTPGYGTPGYGTPAYGTVPTAAYASWIQRVGAAVVDWAATLPFSILASVLGESTDAATGLPTFNALYWVFALLGLAVGGYNRWYLAGKTGQSWGKKVLGLRLVSEETGQPIGAGMAFVREIAHFVDAVTCFIGYLFPLWDDKKQTLADKIVKTVVLK